MNELIQCLYETLFVIVSISNLLRLGNLLDANKWNAKNGSLTGKNFRTRNLIHLTFPLFADDSLEKEEILTLVTCLYSTKVSLSN